MKKVSVFIQAFLDDFFDTLTRLGWIGLGVAAITLPIHFIGWPGWVLVGLVIGLACFRGYIAILVSEAREKAAQRMQE